LSGEIEVVLKIYSRYKKAAYVDLSLFQWSDSNRNIREWTLHDRVMARPRVAGYLSSPRRLAFDEQGIFPPLS
jgi:hypothetical protein